MLREKEGSSATVYTIGHDVLAQVGATMPKYFLHDGHGSVRHLTEYDYDDVLQEPGPTNGDIIESYDFDAYGERLTGPATPATKLLYTGEMYDSHLDFIYLRARWYNPANGRFNRVDPFAGNNSDPQSLHKYLYAHANPINNIDPSGLFNFVTVAVGISMISGLAGMVISGIDVALDKASSIDDIFFAMQVGLLIGVGAGLIGVLLGPAVMAVIAPYVAYLGLILGGIMTIESFANGNKAQGIFRLILTLVTFGLAHPKVRENIFKFVRGFWAKLFPTQPKPRLSGSIPSGNSNRTIIYDPKTKQIHVGSTDAPLHNQVYMEAGLDSSTGDISKLVGGFADFEGGSLVRVEWISGTFLGTEATRAEAQAAAAIITSVAK